MKLTFKEKKKYVLNISNKIKKCLSLLIINFNKLIVNEINFIRKILYNKDVFIYVVRNNLLKIAVVKINLFVLKKFFNKPIIILGSLYSYSYPSKIFEKYFKLYNNKFILKSIYINKKIVSYDIHKKISILYNKKKSLQYLIFYLKNISIIKILRILIIIKNRKY